MHSGKINTRESSFFQGSGGVVHSSYKKVSQKCSHLIHSRSLSALPEGLRLETAIKIDKKKRELYFLGQKKNS
jgi:hypothetical protein